MEPTPNRIPHQFRRGLVEGAVVFVLSAVFAGFNLRNPNRIPHPFWHDLLAAAVGAIFATLIMGALYYWYEEKYIPKKRLRILNHPNLLALWQVGLRLTESGLEGRYKGRFCRLYWFEHGIRNKAATTLGLEFFCEQIPAARRGQIEAATAKQRLLVSRLSVGTYIEFYFSVPPTEKILRQMDLCVRVLEEYGLATRNPADISRDEWERAAAKD